MHAGDTQYCCITLEPVESLHYPVVFIGDTHVFELRALLTWLSKNPTHPISRNPIVVHEGFLRLLCQGKARGEALTLIKIFVHQQQNGKSTHISQYF